MASSNVGSIPKFAISYLTFTKWSTTLLALVSFFIFISWIVVLLEPTCLPYNKDFNPIALGIKSLKKLCNSCSTCFEILDMLSFDIENPKYRMLVYLDNI